VTFEAVSGQLDPLATRTGTGLVERVTFHNPENGFCVLRVNAPWKAGQAAVTA